VSSSSKISSFSGTSLKTSTSNGKSYISGNYKSIPATKGTTKITSSTPKTYIPQSSYYSSGGQTYNHVYYGGSGFDFTSLLLMGYILSHDDKGNTIYVNNATKEYVTEEEFQTPPVESPGMESILAIAGLLAVAFLVMRRE
jgi:hypothetical protein